MGVIYVEIPSDTEDKDVEHFGKAFRKSLNFRFEEHISFTAQLMKKILGDNGEADRRPKWRRALEAFKNSGTVYKTKHNKLPVIYLSAVKEVSQEEWSLVVLVTCETSKLKTVADDFLNGQSFEVNTAQLLRKQLHHEVGKKAIKALLDSKELGFTTFIEFFDNYEEVDKVLETNIFSYHLEKTL
ncbi:unnamed protein product [Rhizophagus irregularis]|uniref:Uncharacterized protein n=1 Tax=Rhizophagus irregularis TaxID=588596 RepID=A0A916EK39_9GLOM|nr:unnamed protein product [Rhizophagus irregularis]